MNKLSIECAAEGSANLLIVFKTPANRDAIDIKSKYGKHILPSVAVNLNFSLKTSNPDTKIFKTDGKKIRTIAQNIDSIISNALKTSDSTAFASSFPLLCSTFENLGRKEELNAPSAKILRKVFANLMAINRASVYIPAPRENTITHSRKNPTILLKRVKDPTVNADLMILIIQCNLIKNNLDSVIPKYNALVHRHCEERASVRRRNPVEITSMTHHCL